MNYIDVVLLEVEHLAEKFPGRHTLGSAMMITLKLRQKIIDAFYDSHGDPVRVMEEVRTLAGVLAGTMSEADFKSMVCVVPEYVEDLRSVLKNGGWEMMIGYLIRAIDFVTTRTHRTPNLRDPLYLALALIDMIGCPLRPRWMQHLTQEDMTVMGEGNWFSGTSITLNEMDRLRRGDG